MAIVIKITETMNFVVAIRVIVVPVLVLKTLMEKDWSKRVKFKTTATIIKIANMLALVSAKRGYENDKM